MSLAVHSTPNYQLTKHPVGSFKEIWTISWPLMLGLLSSSVMLFADRLLLSRYSTAGLNAAATGGMATYILFIIPLIIAGICEVFVGRNHGAGKMTEVGKPVWQMLWFAIALAPFFLLSAYFLPTLFFTGTGNEELETRYFQWMVSFGPAFCGTVALMGFFIGIGQVRYVTISAILGNVVNIALDVILIFGAGPIPEMGVKGAALATGLSQVFQVLFLGSLFLRRSNRLHYGTNNYHFDKENFFESFRIGAPAGLGRFLEVIVHFLFFRIVLLSGAENMTIVTVVQSFYFLMFFIVEGLSKGVSSIAANLIGGEQFDLIRKVLRAALILQTSFFAILVATVIGFSDSLLALFFSSQDITLLHNPQFFATAQAALFWMCVFFLFDGYAWVYMGLLTASGDTKFLLVVSVVLNFAGYLLPSYLILGLANGTAAQGWMVISFYSSIVFLTYLWRYHSGKWKNSIENQPLAA